MISFDQPAVFLLILILPIGIFLQYFWNRSGNRIPFPVSVWDSSTLRPGVSFYSFLYFFCILLFWSSAALLVTALAAPVYMQKNKVITSGSSAIMLVLDESPTMAIKDFPPENRFETAKKVIHQFIRGRENDTIGLVSFSRETALRTPPTVHHGVLNKKLDNLRIMSLGNGTAVGMGITSAVLHLRSCQTKNKIIILLTDGINNYGEIDPIKAALIAKQFQIKIYTIGIGTMDNASAEMEEPVSKKMLTENVSESLNESMLQQVAQISGGSYYSASNPIALEEIFKAIDSIETQNKIVCYEVQTIPQQQILLFLSFIFLLSDLIIRKTILKEIL